MGDESGTTSRQESQFRFNGKKFALTFSDLKEIFSEEELQIKAKLTEVGKKIIETFGSLGVEWIVVAHEVHPTTGVPHVHVGVQTIERCRWRDSRKFDSILGQHPNIKPMTNVRGWIKYITKDGMYVEHPEGVTAEIFSKKSTVSHRIASDLLLKKTSLTDLTKTDSGFVLMNLKKLREFQRHLLDMEMTERKLPSLPLDQVLIKPSTILGMSSCSALRNWIVANLNMQTRIPRTKQLWLHGPPGVGKSRFIAFLSQFFRIYYHCVDDEWFDSYDDDRYDIIVIDEYKGQMRIQLMNRFSSGEVTPLKQRGVAPYLKQKNLPLIVCSNYSIAKCYHKASERNDTGLEGLVDRFLEIEMCEEFQCNVGNPVAE